MPFLDIIAKEALVRTTYVRIFTAAGMKGIKGSMFPEKWSRVEGGGIMIKV
jgi:hypothetical protein